MSTPNPTHIIAEHHAEHGEAGSQQIPGCWCGWQGEVLEHPPWNPIPGVADALHAAHVVSKLTDAGYSIMPAESAWTLSRAQSLAFGTERMDSGDVEYSRGYNTAVDCFRDVLRVADVEGEKP